MISKLQLLCAVAASISIAVTIVGTVSAQTPTAGPTSTATAAPTPDASRPAPTFDAGAMVINATLKFAVSADGLVQGIPGGSKIQVITDGGICTELVLPTEASLTVAATKELRLAPLEVPMKASPDAKALPSCPSPGDRITIVLALPGGANIPLVTTIWSAGTALVDLTVPAPQPLSEAPQRGGGALGLPSTGDGAAGSRGALRLAVVLLVALAVGATSAALALRRRA